jgi:hypothetical protein
VRRPESPHVNYVARPIEGDTGITNDKIRVEKAAKKQQYGVLETGRFLHRHYRTENGKKT